MILMPAVFLAATVTTCDAETRIARLDRGACALESTSDGVRARRCDERDTSREVVVDDGTSSWMGLSEEQACGARPRGLVRFDRSRHVTQAFRGTDCGPCGFRVHDLMIRDGTLWVATDLGVSRLRLSPDDWDEWTHYALTREGDLEETACGALLMPVAEAALAPGGEDVGRLLAEFRPRFVRRLPRGMRPASN